MLINLRPLKSKLLFSIILTAIALIACLRIMDLNVLDTFFYYITKWQSGFNKEIAIKIKLLRDNHNSEVFTALLTTSFLYGMLHAAGPGHGKSILTGWILTQQRSLSDITVATAIATLLHAFSAVAIVGSIFYFWGKYLPGTMGKMYLWLNIAAGVILILVGLQLIYERYKQRSQPLLKKNKITIHPFWIGLSIGIVPCPLAAVMFISCLTADIVIKGLSLVAVFALGMGITLFAVALTVWSIKEKSSQISGFKTQQFFNMTNLISAIFFIVIGILILLPNFAKIQ